MFKTILALAVVAVLSTPVFSSQGVIQDDFDDKYVGYKMDPFIVQESQECLLKPYVPTFGGNSFDIFRGAIYNVDKSKGTTN